MARDYSSEFWSTFTEGHYTAPETRGSTDGHHEGETTEENEATFEDLHQQLLSQMESPQFANRLKAQIRSSLVLQLTPHDVLTAKPPGQAGDPVRELANAVVAQHLATSGCDFTLSVFLPESGLNRELHPMTLPSLLAYLRVKYAGFRADDRSLLSVLVGHLPVTEDAISASFSSLFSTKDGETLQGSTKAVQTEPSQRERDVLQLELELHEVKSRLGWREGEKFVVEDALARFRADVAGDTRRTVLEEALRNKEAEIRHAVEEAQHRHARELLSVTANWEAQMEDQQAKLGILQQRLQIADQKAYVERQDILQQQEAAAQREAQNQDVLESRLKEVGEKERELVARAKQLAEYGQTLQTREAAIQRTVDVRVGEMIRLKAQVLDEREEKLRKDEASLTKLKEHLTRTIMNESGEPDVTASVEPKPFLQKIKSEFSRLHRENQKLKTRLATIADYETLKFQKSDYEREVKTLRAQVASLQRDLQSERQEHTAMVRELTEKVVQPDHNIELLRREAETARERLQLEGLRWDAERGKLKSVVKDRGREIDRLKDRLAQQQEKYDAVNAKLTRMQDLSSQATRMMTQAQPAPAPTPTPTLQIRLRPTVPPPEPLSGDESSSSFGSINDAKKRIKALEVEATNMQAHFSQYRRYVTTQFHSPPAGRPAPSSHDQLPPSSFAVAPRDSPSTLPGRPDVPRKLLLTQYLLQEPRQASGGQNGGLVVTGSGGPTPPRLFSSLSGGDLGLTNRSLEMELREAEASVRNELDGPLPKEPADDSPISLGLEVESRIDADVRELMASVNANGNGSLGEGADFGW